MKLLPLLTKENCNDDEMIKSKRNPVKCIKYLWNFEYVEIGLKRKFVYISKIEGSKQNGADKFKPKMTENK